MKAAEYVANVADTQPIEQVAEEVNMVMANSPTVKQAVSEFWCGFWKEIDKRFGKK